jgi:tetratricopeptide (TPR) repeat protein
VRRGGPRQWAQGLVVALASSASLALAQGSDLEAGREFFREVEYEKAIEALKRALRSDSSREGRIEAYLLLAKSYRALGRTEDAVGAFRSLLQIDPSYRLSPKREPPSLIEIFERARQQEPPPERPPPPKILHSPVRRGYGGLGVTFHAEILHFRPEYRARVFFRQIGQIRYQSLDLSRREGNHFVGTIPGAELMRRVEDYLLEYYLAVTDPMGEVLARVGSEEKPLTMRVVLVASPPPKGATLGSPPPWYRRHWWIWVAVGAVVVGGALTAATLAR